MIDPELLSLDYYQLLSSRTAKVIDSIPAEVYTALGLCGESGEVAEKIKKHYRDGLDREHTRAAVKKELGDVLWYLAQTAKHFDLLLSEVAAANLEKLADRRDRGVISGSGDER